jgi:hypothetical protein
MITAKTGIISTVAGGGTAGQLGDGGLATAASLSDPSDIAFDSAGNLYILDSGNARIRKVEQSTGIITTVAGNGEFADTGDGGPATAAEINTGQGIAVDGAGNIYLSNSSDTVRKVSASTGNISTVFGVDYLGYAGDGGSAAMAELNYPQGLAFDANGSLYIADIGNNVVRKVTFPVAPAVTWPTPAAIFYGTALSATQLDATSPVAGTFTYSPAAGKVLAAGSQTLSATLTPTDTIDYFTTTATVQLTVNKAIPAVTETLSASGITTVQTLTVTVGVSASGGGQVPTGSVTLSGGGCTSAATSLVSGSATISVAAGSLSVGSDAFPNSDCELMHSRNYRMGTQGATLLPGLRQRDWNRIRIWGIGEAESVFGPRSPCSDSFLTGDDPYFEDDKQSGL